MGMALLVQLQIGGLHLVGDPGAVGIGARGGAGLDDGGEVVVEGDPVALLAQQLFQAAGNMQFVRQQHRARVGRPPENWLAILVPGETAVAVRLHQPLGAQVAAGGKQAIGFAQGFFQWREVEVVAVEPGQHGRRTN
ncbi:hypothetical protein D3C84_486130 [compost metagenome]